MYINIPPKTFSNTKEIRVLIYTINPTYKIFLAKMVFLCTIHFKLSILSSLFVITVDSHHLLSAQEGKIILYVASLPHQKNTSQSNNTWCSLFSTDVIRTHFSPHLNIHITLIV